MSGQKKKYEIYLKSLEMMREPIVPKVRLDMRGARLYAMKKGVAVKDLTEEEKAKFITAIQ